MHTYDISTYSVSSDHVSDSSSELRCLGSLYVLCMCTLTIRTFVQHANAMFKETWAMSTALIHSRGVWGQCWQGLSLFHVVIMWHRHYVASSLCDVVIMWRRHHVTSSSLCDVVIICVCHSQFWKTTENQTHFVCTKCEQLVQVVIQQHWTWRWRYDFFTVFMTTYHCVFGFQLFFLIIWLTVHR